MASVIKEYSSPRSDHSVLIWNEEESFIIPFCFDIKVKTSAETKDFVIPKDWTVEIVIKDDVRHIQPLFVQTATNIDNNTIFFKMDEKTSKKFRGGRYYHLNARLYNDAGVQQKILINDLPIYVNEG